MEVTSLCLHLNQMGGTRKTREATRCDPHITDCHTGWLGRLVCSRHPAQRKRRTAPYQAPILNFIPKRRNTLSERTERLKRIAADYPLAAIEAQIAHHGPDTIATWLIEREESLSVPPRRERGCEVVVSTQGKGGRPSVRITTEAD